MKRLCGLVLLIASACGTPYVVRYTVKPGEDAASIARTQGTTEERLRELNRLRPEDRLRPGDTVFIPGAPPSRGPAPSGRPSASAPPPRSDEPSSVIRSPGATPPTSPVAPSAARPASRATAPPPSRPQAPTGDADGGRAALAKGAPVEKSGKGLNWPLPGEILRGFGKSPAGENRGIDIGAPAGTPVRAAAAGRVTYAGVPARAYGPVVILEHGEGLHTVYSNLQSLSVARDESIQAGQPIGTSGDKAITPFPHLHFEVRRNGEAVDPLLLLPPR